MIQPTLPLVSVAAMVTLYNSEIQIIDRISTYINQVSVLYLIDNSDQPNSSLIQSILIRYPKAKYINNNGNKGIAYALNVAAQAAIDDQFDYLLLMDDDSEAPIDLVLALYQIMQSSAYGPIGIVSAKSDPNVKRSDVQKVLTTITSGSLLNIHTYQLIGPFMNELFIDWVDHEYSFRLRRHGFCTLVANHIHLKHRLGHKKIKRLLGFVPIQWWSHSPVRMYYKFRNIRYVFNRYSDLLPLPFILYTYFELFKDIIKILLIEDTKRQYISLINRGLADAKHQRLGKLLAE